MRDKAKEKGTEFENVVEKIYLQLADNERITAKVEKNVPMIGNDGGTHEIDVLYSFERFGIHYRVAIECKNWKKPINISALRDFAYKLEHIGNINGVFISAESSFQQGAKRVSEFNGIKLVKYDDFYKFLFNDSNQCLIPDYKTVGDPFWTLINIDGKNEIEQNLVFEGGILLFESKYFAEQYRKLQFADCPSNIKLVGVTQLHLKLILSLKNEKKISVKFFNQFKSNLAKLPYHFFELDTKDIEMYIR